jgi:hypothetical protein
MVERGSGARLALEALQRRIVGTELGREELQGVSTAQGDIFRLIDHAHAATT